MTTTSNTPTRHSAPLPVGAQLPARDRHEIPPALFESLVEAWVEILTADYLARHADQQRDVA